MTRPVALVHEWLASRSGSEKTFEAMTSIIPAADRYALTVEREVPFEVAGDVRATMLQRSKLLRRRRQLVLPLMPLAWKAMRPPRYDTVITSSHAFSRCFPTRGAAHLSYVFTPLRYAWLPEIDGRGSGRVAAPARAALRAVDRHSTKGVTSFAAISTAVRERVEAFYGRSAVVVFPPVDTDFFRPGPERRRGDHVLGVSRWIPYKRMDLVILAAERAGRPAVIAGAGPEEARLRALAGAVRVPITFVHRPTDEALRDLYRAAAAVVFPSEEDFGIVAVEAQATGTPVVALGKAGSLDTVVDGATGVLVGEQTAEAFAEGIERASTLDVRADRFAGHVAKFSRNAFRRRFAEWVGPWVPAELIVQDG